MRHLLCYDRKIRIEYENHGRGAVCHQYSFRSRFSHTVETRKGAIAESGRKRVVPLGLANKICPTVVFAESYRDLFTRIFRLRFSVDGCYRQVSRKAHFLYHFHSHIHIIKMKKWATPTGSCSPIAVPCLSKRGKTARSIRSNFLCDEKADNIRSCVPGILFLGFKKNQSKNLFILCLPKFGRKGINMKTPIFKGAATALITPFRDHAIDFEAFGAIIDAQLAGGIDALVICGTTGEASTLTDDEQISAIAFAAKRVAGRIPVIAGAGSNDTAHAISLCQKSCEVGADGLLVVTPYYNKTSQKGLIHMYTRIADNVNKPLILYNVPSRTGVNIEPATYAALADHPNINGIKEASGNFSKIVETVSLVGDKLALYSGNDDQIVPMLSLGGSGVISVLSNVLPAETSKMCKLFFEGNVKESAAMQCRYLPLINALFSDVNPIPVKEAMAMLGNCTSEMREPLYPIDETKKAVLREKLTEAGLAVKN